MSKEHPQPPTYEQLGKRRDNLASLIDSRKATLGRIGIEGTQHPLFTTDTGDLKIARVSDRLARYIASMETSLKQVGNTMDTLAFAKAQQHQHEVEVHAGILAGIKAHVIPQTQVLVEHHEAKHQGMLAQAEEDPAIKRGLELIAQKEAAPTPLGSIEGFQKPRERKPREPRPAKPTPEAKPFQLAEGVTVAGLTPKEEEILLHVQCYPDQTSKAQIAQAVWPNVPLGKSLHTLSVNLGNLRAKIKPAGYYVNIVEGNYLLETSQRSVPIRPEKKPGIPKEPTSVTPADATPAVSPASSDIPSEEGKKI